VGSLTTTLCTRWPLCVRHPGNRSLNCTSPWPMALPATSPAKSLMSCSSFGKSLVPNKLPSIFTNVKGGGTIQVPTLLLRGHFSAGICQPKVFDCLCYNLVVVIASSLAMDANLLLSFVTGGSPHFMFG